MGIVTKTSSNENTIDVTARRLMRALVSYLGWPLHLISSVGSLLFDKVLPSLRKYALKRQGSSARRITRRPLRHPVRLKNLPQVSYWYQEASLTHGNDVRRDAHRSDEGLTSIVDVMAKVISTRVDLLQVSAHHDLTTTLCSFGYAPARHLRSVTDPTSWNCSTQEPRVLH